MISDLFMLTILLSFVAFSFTRPHVALALAVWVNIINPQNLSFSFLAGKPLSFLTTVFFFIVFIINIKKIKVPKSKTYHFLMIGFMIWITIATYRAEFQSVAWIKYDYSIKTLIFAYFIPFVLVQRRQIELFIWVCALSFGLFLFMAGVKTALGGGGYGVNLVGVGYFLYAEGSTLSTIAISMAPIFLYLKDKSFFSESKPIFKYILWGYLACCILTIVGTQARTGIVVLALFSLLIIKKYKFRPTTLGLFILIPVLIYSIAPSSWFERMNSIEQGTTSEKSALGRIVVWRWTIDYVMDKPVFGGGFYSYNANAGKLDQYQKGQEVVINQKGGKAFHNIFFEVLGEAGYGGLILFLGIIIHTLMSNSRIKRVFKDTPGVWQSELAESVNFSLMIYCLGGMFVGIAFYPWMYYLYGASISLSNLGNTRNALSHIP